MKDAGHNLDSDRLLERRCATGMDEIDLKKRRFPWSAEDQRDKLTFTGKT